MRWIWIAAAVIIAAELIRVFPQIRRRKRKK